MLLLTIEKKCEDKEHAQKPQWELERFQVEVPQVFLTVNNNITC